MLDKNTLVPVAVTLGVLAAINNIRALRSVKRFIIG
ncbi:Peptidoglycan hydrolase P7 [Pseudoalteromonas maricaloris]